LKEGSKGELLLSFMREGEEGSIERGGKKRKGVNSQKKFDLSLRKEGLYYISP